MDNLFNVCWMPVEPQYAAEVQALLQSLRARDGVETSEAPVGERDGQAGGRRRHNGGGVVWAAEEYDSFMAAGQESYRRVRVFADVLAASPGERFTTTAACEGAGITPTQLRAALGKFTTWMRATTSNEHWPFGWAYGEDIDPTNPSEFHYEMSGGQASAWRAAQDRKSKDQ